MATLKEEAMAYEPQQTLNIADLDKVPVDLEVYESEEKVKKNDKGEIVERFTYKFAKLNGKEYRIPASVLEEIQTILKLKPTVEFVKVKKTGSGLGTKYKVDAL